MTIASESPQYTDRIVVDPDVMVGKPVVRGTRIPVELVLGRLARDLGLKTLFEDYPRLTVDDIKACIEYAQALVAGEVLFPAQLGVKARRAESAT